MIIAYDLCADDNDSYMYELNNENPNLCKECGFIINLKYLNPNFRVKKRIFDISYTYDNRCIVSVKFKVFCKRLGYKGIDFLKLPNDKEYFYFSVNNIIKIDIERKKIYYNNLCKTCGNYESITPATPIILKDIHSPLEDGFYWTDISFGSGNEKEPLTIVGVKTVEKMKKEKFKGAIYLPIKI